MSSTRTILLVEDNPDDAELTRRAFEKNKIANQLVHVTDGEEALEYLFATGRYASRSGDSNPTVVLLDLKLPKVSGLEVLQKLRAEARTRRLPVVVLTSSNEERDLVASYELGANSFIVKPVEFDSFARAVTEVGLYWMLLNRPAM